MNIDVTIPIKSYLKQFISHHSEVEPFVLKPTRCHYSKLFLEPFLNEVKPEDKKGSSGDTDITVRFDESVISKRQIILDSSIVRNINYSLKSLFDQQLCDFITIQIERKGDIKNSALLFLEYYDISEDDLTFDAVIKMYYRARTYSPPTRKERMTEIIEQLQLDFPTLTPQPEAQAKRK